MASSATRGCAQIPPTPILRAVKDHSAPINPLTHLSLDPLPSLLFLVLDLPVALLGQINTALAALPLTTC